MRLIDADKIEYTSIAQVASYPVAPSPCDTVMRTEINAMPTINAVPVIRCKDCKWNKSKRDWVDCIISEMYGRKASDNYCSLAERKEE